MRFARTAFLIAGVWGILLLSFLYVRGDTTGASATAAGAQFYFGFLAVTMAWQIAFLVIASDPMRYRPLMPVAMLEKLGYIVSMIVLYRLGRVGRPEASTAVPDAALLVLFVMAYLRTPGHRGR